MFGLSKPKRAILGFELAGEIEAVGKDVKKFKEGDHVFGITGTSFGAYAEYICMDEDSRIITKPVNITYEEAAVIPFGATTALFFLRDKANLQSGSNILINGASGSTGVYAIQLAKFYGADITGVCSTANINLVKSLGAHHVVDYTKEDFRKNGKTYDIIMDTVPGKTSFYNCKNSLNPNGHYLAVAGGLKEMLQTPWTAMRGGKKVCAGMAPDRKEDLVFLKELIKAEKLKAVIDRHYFLEQMAEAHRYVDQGHKKGNVVIRISQMS
jgi:NADPH:quinone reductase-like Zn-dependent oxidoreductase